MTPHVESIQTLCLYGDGSGLGVEPIDFEWVSWLCHQLNMLGKLYLSDLRIDNLFGAGLKIAAVSSLILNSRERRRGGRNEQTAILRTRTLSIA